MFLLIRGFPNGDVDYFGPFPTKERAEKYAESFDEKCRWHVKPLIVPNCVSVKLVY